MGTSGIFRKGGGWPRKGGGLTPIYQLLLLQLLKMYIFLKLETFENVRNYFFAFQKFNKSHLDIFQFSGLYQFWCELWGSSVFGKASSYFYEVHLKLNISRKKVIFWPGVKTPYETLLDKARFFGKIFFSPKMRKKGS